MKKDLKQEIFKHLEENKHLLDNPDCNEILLKKFYPKVKPEEIKSKKKYISKVKNEFINRDKLLFDEDGTVIAKQIEFKEPEKIKEPEFDKKLVEDIANEVVDKKLILTQIQQQKLLELLNKPEPQQQPIKQQPQILVIKDVDGEKERYNIRILISAMEKLKKYAKNNNTNASAVIETLINQYL